MALFIDKGLFLLQDKFKRAFRRLLTRFCKRFDKDQYLPDFSDDYTIRTSFSQSGKYRTSLTGSNKHHRRSTKHSSDSIEPAMV